MKKALLFLFFVFSISLGFSKGTGGVYYIEGTAFSTANLALKNVLLVITIGEKTKTIRTDSNGHFRIEVEWQTACPSVVKPFNRRKANKELNPKYIFIACEVDEKKLKNKWRKYRNSTYHQDFYFSL